MVDERIKKIRQICVSVMLVCLSLLAVFVVQRKTEVEAAVTEPPVLTEPEGTETTEKSPVLSVEELFGKFLAHGVTHTPWSRLFGTRMPEAMTQDADFYVIIRKNGASFEEITEEQIYRKATLRFSGSVTKDDVFRISGNSLYIGDPVVPEVIIPEELKNVPLVREPKSPEEDSLLSLAVTETDGMSEVTVEFNSVYEAEVAEDEEFLFLALVPPYKKYDKIIVIDAGHGGYDPGTSGGGVTEASVNLAVVKYVKELVDTRPEWKVYYTRLNNTLPDLSTRVEFANALHADMLISVHCNSHPSSSMNGVEVLYSGKQGLQDELNSRVLSELCSNYVTEETGLRERLLVERSSNLHIIKYCTMPMALIEFGYMSNKNDLAVITTEEAQRACAYAIYRAIEEAYKILDGEQKE